MIQWFCYYCAPEFKRTRWVSLADIQNYLHDPILDQELHLLQKALYSQRDKLTNGWSGDHLWHYVSTCKNKMRKRYFSTPLPELYPDITEIKR